MRRREDVVSYSYSNPYESHADDQFRVNFNRALSGTIIGATAGLASTTIAETKINLAKGVTVSAGLRPYEGLNLQSGDCKAYLQNAPIATHLPFLSGVSIKTEDKTLLCRNPEKVISDPRLKALSTLASQRKQGITEPVKDSFVARAEHGATAGALSFVLLPVLGAVALKRFSSSNIKRSLVDAHKLFRRNKPLVAITGTLAVGCVVGGTVGCASEIGVQAKNIKKQIDDKPVEAAKIPGQLGIYQPDATRGALIKGKQLQQSINTVLRSVTRGERTWNKAKVNLISEIAAPQIGYEYLYDQNHKYYKILVETGVLCNTAFTKSIAPLLQADVRPNLTLDAGDRQIAGGRNGFIERHCESNLTRNYHAKYFFAKGNHDQTNSYEAQVREIDGQKYVTAADPRARFGDQDHDSVKGEALKRALALQGSKIALTVCAIYYKTGIKPDVVAHTLDSAIETISKGCAANIYTDHPVFENIDLSRGSVFRNYLSSDGSTSTDVLISTSSAGAIKRNTPYAGPEKTGDVVIQYSTSPKSRFVKAIVFSWNKDGNTKLFEVDPPKPQKMPLKFNEILEISPTAG
jgi:hypothetical protein